MERSLDENVVSEECRTANVSPVYKKSFRGQVDNYRPVSLTSQVGKILDSIIRDAVVEHLVKNKLIKSSQHGFLKNRSCLTNLLVFFESVTKSVDDGHNVDVMFLDFAKAFDKVPHHRLLMKLKSHGINGKVYN